MPVRFWYAAHITYDLIKLDIHQYWFVRINTNKKS